MNSADKADVLGTVLSPKFHSNIEDSSGGQRQNRRYFTYQTCEGLVAGYAVSITFDIDQPARAVWPHFKDFNRWQNSHHYYSGVVGDLEGKTYRVADKPGELGLYDYHVIRVIPEHLIVASEPVPADGSTGGVRRGFHVFMLSEHAGRTAISIMMEHSSQTSGKTSEGALSHWRAFAPEMEAKWRDHFIPALRKSISGK